MSQLTGTAVCLEDSRRPAARNYLPGLALVLLIALGAGWVAGSGFVRGLGLGSLTLAMIFGGVVGNTVYGRLRLACEPGAEYAAGGLLRLGIVLYGFHITLQDLALVGWSGLLTSAVMVCSTFLLAVYAGTRLLRLDRQSAMLIGAGSAICGAAAVIAVAPVLRAPPHKVAVAVATVVLFGTLGMFLYPLAHPYLGLGEQAYGAFVGSTLHEVAQVVVAGGAVGAEAAHTAVLVKMLRVMLLMPFLLLLSGYAGAQAEGGRSRLTVPWFALLFLGVIGVNSLVTVPAPLLDGLLRLDAALLAMAMAALGLRTRVAAVVGAGRRPMLLALLLFGFLFAGGYGVNLLLGGLSP
ncbi:YeiH family protein [Alkalilimnicola sp. S0819]|uniref:YeiH family protein n=1 Tax=Alkalilimnicola sp. S0819 TaxID=2613922 RepID=UPI0012618243|nr:YeiH family putative sulfate export transporter [Alkalilimnicola sp. S0819]KAB7623158.1 YeiH family putative sulfate export transporter [Alkalilimnicola sp. S0819]MPQ17002.1 YeiH family putative sulfate export transporter [Alkalilimnicola sp. S0819]